MAATAPEIAANLQRIGEEIARAALAAGRQPDSVRLVAVSKTMPNASIEAAYAAGQRVFGENRVQELEGKAAALPADIEWHLIGHLQSNKVKQAIGCSSLIHSIDSERLLRRTHDLAEQAGKVQAILLQANVSGETSKFGESLEDLAPLVELAMELPNVTCRGLMTMAPFDAESDELRRIFGALRAFRDRLETRLGVALPELSMGMSGDFREAIAEGATLVRVGTAIFGSR